jgi:hypothetical protein
VLCDEAAWDQVGQDETEMVNGLHTVASGRLAFCSFVLVRNTNPTPLEGSSQPAHR